MYFSGKRLSMNFEARACVAVSPVARKLLQVMAQKQSTLCVAADVKTGSELLNLARLVGPHICLLKTHADMVANFTPNIADELITLATEMNFLILEDR
jgi:uridine monophosphate synthetase